MEEWNDIGKNIIHQGYDYYITLRYNEEKILEVNFIGFRKSSLGTIEQSVYKIKFYNVFLFEEISESWNLMDNYFEAGLARNRPPLIQGHMYKVSGAELRDVFQAQNKQYQTLYQYLLVGLDYTLYVVTENKPSIEKIDCLDN